MNIIKDTPLTVGIEDGDLVIRVGIVLLDGNDYHPTVPKLTFTSTEEWVKDVINALKAEREDGSTPVCRMLDSAIHQTIKNKSSKLNYNKP